MSDNLSRILLTLKPTRSEIAFADAPLHLAEVLQSGDNAVRNIMDYAERIQQAAQEIGGEQEKQLMNAARHIIEACTFQDVSSQRLNSVIRLLQHIEERLGKTVSDNKIMPFNPHDTGSNVTDGPQLPGKGMSQGEINLMFAGKINSHSA